MSWGPGSSAWTTTVGSSASRRRTRSPKGITIHAMGEFIELGEEDFIAWQYLTRIGLSAHAFVTPSGVIVRQVPDDRVAFHARGFNSTHLGIEVCVPGIHTLDTLYTAMETPWVTQPALDATVAQVKLWMGKFNISVKKVVGHDRLNPRKRDPGRGFPWPEFVARLTEG